MLIFACKKGKHRKFHLKLSVTTVKKLNLWIIICNQDLYFDIQAHGLPIPKFMLDYENEIEDAATHIVSSHTSGLER